MSDAEKALREAHDMVEYELGRCEGSVEIDAAINLAVRAAWEAGFANGMQTSAHALDNTPPPDDPDWLPKEES